ncbi:hypothetical protein PsorP6_005267 [Peronosclerospora sorghi]|uniref:Uncharacterized protein n=1 Tax=Peronosclerospora sorghi TaxID=230839 RepID=A0ACC0W5H0_9STRA|nr:hypothetical protein PsorP6_005267 [Peronosclerospora sorghi]
MSLDKKLRKKLDKRDLTEVVVIGGNHTTASILYRMDWGYRSAKNVAGRSGTHVEIGIMRSNQDSAIPSSVSRATNDENDRNAVYCVLITSEKDMRTVSVTEPFVLVNNLPVPLTYRVRSAFSSAYGSGTSDSPSEPETIAVGAKTSIWWTDIGQRPLFQLVAETLLAAQVQGFSLVQAQAKGQFASKDYIAKAQSHISSETVQTSLSSPSMSSLVSQKQANQLQAQIQVNAQKIHAQVLATAQAQGLKPMQAQEKAKQAKATYVHRASAQAQAKIARAQSQGLVSSLVLGNTSSAVSRGPFALKSQQEAPELHYQGLRLIRSISKLHPSWLASQTVIINCLRKLWRSPARIQRLLAHDRLPIKFHLESKVLIKCFITYSRVNQGDVQVLLDMFSVFLHRTPFDFSFLQTFYLDEVATKYSAGNKRNLIDRFCECFVSLGRPRSSRSMRFSC